MNTVNSKRYLHMCNYCLPLNWCARLCGLFSGNNCYGSSLLCVMSPWFRFKPTRLWSLSPWLCRRLANLAPLSSTNIGIDVIIGTLYICIAPWQAGQHHPCRRVWFFVLLYRFPVLRSNFSACVSKGEVFLLKLFGAGDSDARGGCEIQGNWPQTWTKWNGFIVKMCLFCGCAD